MSAKRKVIFNGDAVVATGFAKATHKICEVLRHAYDVIVLGINYDAADPRHGYPYQIFPANPARMFDAWGVGRLATLLPAVNPDLLVVQNDPWNVAVYVEKYAKIVPIVAFMPVDGKNIQGHLLNGLALAIFYTQFALDEARRGGYTGPGCVVGLGVDRTIYTPMSRQVARDAVIPPGKVPPDGFVVGNVNRNQPRKRIDLTLQYFAEWIRQEKIGDAWLYLHLAPTGDRGWDVPQLARYYGISNRLVMPKKLKVGVGVPEPQLAAVYSCMNVQVNTGVGEGFGLTALEGMACGIPLIAGDWSGLGDWARPAAELVECTSTMANINEINVIGGVPDEGQFIQALDRMYRDKAYRDEKVRRSYALACQPQFEWNEVGMAFGEALEEAMAATL